MTDARGAPTSETLAPNGPSGDGARPRGHLVLLSQLREPALDRSELHEPDLGRVESDRILAESRRYRLAVIRQARRRLRSRERADRLGDGTGGSA